MRWPIRIAAGLAMLLAGAAALLIGMNRLDENLHQADPLADSGLQARGEYLARVGNCTGCHTPRGGPALSGGRGIETPFGTVYSSNLTPDPDSGLGRWSADDFWRALHNGRSRDGRLLYPAFPYTNYSLVTRSDADALFVWLRSQAPVASRPPAHALRFPYNTQAALAVWRALYFRPGTWQPDPARSANWNRGAYLVQGLGHCSACHAPRNALGASEAPLDLAGGLIPVLNWYAPALNDETQAGVSSWEPGQVVELLRQGRTARAWVSGPMAGVVVNSTQYLSDGDAAAMTEFLRQLPGTGTGATASPATPASPARVDARGAGLYEDHCAGCHGKRGEGVPGAYPPLAGNRAVSLHSVANLVQIVLHGGFGAATREHPRPYGMPPFALTLGDPEIASVLSHVRRSWGNQAGEVQAIEVSRLRASARE